jgi:hypothetical protein
MNKTPNNENGIYSRKGAKAAKKIKFIITIETQTNQGERPMPDNGLFSFAFLACLARYCFSKV